MALFGKDGKNRHKLSRNEKDRLVEQPKKAMLLQNGRTRMVYLDEIDEILDHD